MKHNLSIATVLAAAFLLAPACSKEKKTEPESAAQEKPLKAEELKVTASESDVPVAMTAIAASELLKYLPADTELVLSFSMQSLSSSPLWKRLGPLAMASASKELAQVQESCIQPAREAAQCRRRGQFQQARGAGHDR